MRCQQEVVELGAVGERGGLGSGGDDQRRDVHRLPGPTGQGQRRGGIVAQLHHQGRPAVGGFALGEGGDIHHRDRAEPGDQQALDERGRRLLGVDGDVHVQRIGRYSVNS